MNSRYKELREAYKQCLADNQLLMSENRKLRNALMNVEVKLRILTENMERKNGDNSCK